MLGFKILIVEDSITQAVRLEHVLNNEGFCVINAINGQEALKKLDQEKIDIVISDVVMPQMDGYELCEKIRSNPKYLSIPVILLTSLAEPGDIVRGLKSGATNFVTKPYDEDFLISRVKSVLKHSALKPIDKFVQKVEFDFHGSKHQLNADFGHVFQMLLSTYENTLLQARQLDIANRKLSDREQQLSSVLASMTSKIAVIDTNSNLITVNDSWKNLFAKELSEKEVLGKNFEQIIKSSNCYIKELDEFFEGLRGVLAGKRDKFSMELSLAVESSSVTSWYHLEVTKMCGDTGAVASLHNITDRKIMERELIKARDTAENTSRFKSRFLASMSHEIRTPLNAVIGMTDLTLRSPLSIEQRENLEIVRISAEQLLVLINDILDLSKVEARMLKLFETDFSLNFALSSVVKSMEQQATDKGLDLSIEFDAAVPDIVFGDESRLKQVLYNLVGNSIKFTERGSIRVYVNCLGVNDAEDEMVIRVSVKDTGIGIPTDKQKLIFDSFRQADDSTTRKFGGSGLGLAISREIVEIMNGTIKVVSSIGEGSTFTFSIKLKKGDPNNVETSYSPPEIDSCCSTSKCCRILLVEDNAINVKVTTSVLRKMGHKVYIASNGIEAITSVAKIDVDLVLMDLEMPEMDGFVASQKIRNGVAGEKKVDIPIVAMSAHAMSGIKDKCEKSGMNGYIAKPVQYPDLENVINEMIKLAPSLPHEEVEEEKSLNMDQVKDLYYGEEELYFELCKMFLADIAGDISQCAGAISSGDMETARRVAHTLKSSCASICAPKAREIAVSLEQAIIAGNSGAMQKGLSDIFKESERIRFEFNSMV